MQFFSFLLTLLGLVTINYKYAKKQINKQTNKQTKKQEKQTNKQTINNRIQVMLPKRVGTNGRPMRGTARLKKMKEYKMHDKIEKRKWICNTNLRINIKLVRVCYGRWHAQNLTEDQVHGHSTPKVLRESNKVSLT